MTEAIDPSFDPSIEKDIQSKNEVDLSVEGQEEVEQDAQPGVRTVEAITMSWSKTWLIITYAW